MKILKLRNRTITTELPAFVMGILNATPDSFFEKSRGGVELAKKLIDSGADILDIGAESTRPGSQYISEEEELARLIPVIQSIRNFSDIPISVDTRRSSVFKKAFEAGADIFNDISAFEDDPFSVTVAAETEVPVILMHKRGNPESMQKNTEYQNVFDSVNGYLMERASFAEKNGIQADKIIVDPGIGFGKDLNGNVELVKNCGKLCGGKYKVLMALSRKTFLGQITGKDVAGRLPSTLAANLLSVLYGADMVRVHDVDETVDILKVLSYIRQ